MIWPRIDHIGLNVRNLDESIGFYRDFFGFDLIEEWDDPKQAFVGKGELTLGLMELPDYNFRAYTMAHLAFPVSEEAFPEVVDRVRRFKLEVVAGPKPQRGGETILFRDPSGNILEVCYPSITEWKERI